MGEKEQKSRAIIAVRLPNWLGDVVMSTPCIELLLAHFPNCKLILIGRKSALELFANDSRIAARIVDDTKGRGLIGRLRATWELGKSVRACVDKLAQELDSSTNISALDSTSATHICTESIAITLTNHFFSALLLYASGMQKRIGYVRGIGGLLLTHSLSHKLARQNNAHQVLRYTYLLRPLLAESALNIHAIPELHLCYTPLPSMPLAQSPLAPSKHALDSTTTPTGELDSRVLYGKHIGLNPGAAYGSAKCWEKESYAKCAAILAHKGARISIYGVAQDSTLAQDIITLAIQMLTTQTLESARTNAPHEENRIEVEKIFSNRCGETSVPELIQEIAGLDAFITNDSGSMHIAAAVGTPMIAVFGPTDMTETSPWRAKSCKLLSSNAPCAPCKKRICPIRDSATHHQCMKLLRPEQVIDELQSLLESTQQIATESSARSKTESKNTHIQDIVKG